MGSNTHGQVTYMDELRRGNYVDFVRHVLDQIPDSFKLSPSEIKLLNDYRDYLLSIGIDLARTYCSAMSMTSTEFFKRESSDCIEVIKRYWHDFLTDVGNDEHWVKMGIHMLRLFNANVGVAALVTMPTHLSLLAVLRAVRDGKPIGQLSNILGKLSILVSAFYSELLVHLLTESVGASLSAFMILAGHFVEQLINVYGNTP